jgi:GNAT superfamily N-acetyltransferase
MKDSLLHHLYFLSKHRGCRETLPGLELIHSDKLDFNIAFLLKQAAIEHIPPGYQVYLPDWTDIPEAVVADTQRLPAMRLAYMRLAGQTPAPENPESWSIRQAEGRRDIEVFSGIQARSFNEDDADFAEWHPWLLQNNLKNYPDPDQLFYIGYLDDRPVGVALAVYHQQVAGIYAVATLPEFRKQGVSTRILDKVVLDAHGRNAKEIVLQTAGGSEAERLYKKRGFEKEFECVIFS